MSRLNLSQTEIAMAQQVCPNSAKNTISLKLYLPEHTPAAVKEAADTVLSCADIFAASLCRSGREWTLVLGGKRSCECSIEKEGPAELAEERMEASDRTAFDPEQRLWQAQVLPVSGGGVFLYVRFHHIIIDGYGMSLFVQRVLDVLAGKKIRPSVFAREGVAARDASGEDVFWRQYFSGADYEPSVFGRSTAGGGYGSYHVSVAEDLMRQTALFAEREGVSVPSVFAAAFAFYLAEATDKRDAVFLMPRLNRTPEEMDTLGCFTLLVPVRVTVERTDTFAALCRKVKDAAREASAHKGCGFDRILSVLREESPAMDSVSDYVFNFYRFVFRTKVNYSVRFSVAGEMQNHLTCNLFWNESGGLDLVADYRVGVYTEETAAFFCDAILSIVSGGLRCEGGAGHAVLRDMRILGKAEYDKVTSVEGKSFPVDGGLTIPSLFSRAASLYGDRPALYAGEASLTFRELYEVSGRIACGLIRRGIRRGDCVAFLLKRDFRLIAAVLGISKAGAAFVPVDPAYPADRISYILENSQAALLISSADVRIAAEYDFIGIDALLKEEAKEELFPEIRQEDLAYLIYTSGTTGRPKGVMLTHRGIANIVHPDNNPFNRDITKNGRGIVAIGSICFDISLFEIFVPLMNGLFVELGSEKAMLDAGELAAHIVRHGADILHCTPSRIAAYLENAAFSGALSGVKAILAAGEVLPEGLAKRLADTYHIRVYNGYGPTETTIGATITGAGDTVSIGRPIANTGVVLLNRGMRPVPCGAAGEICVYGNGVGIGYRNRPKETEEKFIFWNGRRLYRTGDLGRFLEDGRLLYGGRNDRQVKLRGLRIELSEIETVMGAYPGIASCCCLIRKIEKTDHLAGFYTAAKGAEIDAAALREHMKARLTSYMVPDILKELSQMPQTPNGKMDIKALEAESVTYVRAYRRPESEREVLVCDVFQEVLSVRQAGLDDNFFELGGDSLAAASAVLLIGERLGLRENELEFGDLFRYPTPSLLLEKIGKGSGSSEGFDLKSLDYSGFDAWIDAHTAREAGNACLGNVLLTGVTGYLGIHILIDLLGRPGLCGKIICLSRTKKNRTAERRVKSSLFYYAEEDFSDCYGQTWTVVEGDITEPDVFTQGCPFPVDTIINCAADVSHFSYGDHLEQINTAGVRNLIALAKKENALLCQISTISVAGAAEAGAEKNCFSEKDFYIGQKIGNKYIYSKYRAEYEMLRAAVDEGLRIKVMRVGNLQGRIRDGEFQMNLHSNAFTRRFSAYARLGAVPQSFYEGGVNFSPVDETAHRIVTLAATGEETAVFHVYPPTELKLERLIFGLRKLGYPMEVLPDDAFQKLLGEKRQTEEGREQLQGLVTSESAGDCREIPVSQEITDGYIRQMGEDWSVITEEYIDSYLSALNGMDLF